MPPPSKPATAGVDAAAVAAAGPAPRFGPYLAWMLGSAAAALALCAGINAAMDPLGLYGAPRIEGLNAKKPLLDHHRDLAAWKASQRLCTPAAIFGNSRAEIGLDPAHPAFAARGMAAFSEAIPGTSLVTAAQRMDWRQQAGCAPRLMVVGVDFYGFLGGRPRPAGTPAGDYPAPSAPPAIDGTVLAETLLSVTALRDALYTLRQQRAQHPAIITPLNHNPLYPYLDEVAGSGHHVLFRQRAQESMKLWENRAHRIRRADGGPSAEAEALQTLLLRAGQPGRGAAATSGAAAAAPGAPTEVHLVLYPYHQLVRVIAERLGQGALFSDWKREVLRIAREAEAASAGRLRVTVWDFNGVSPETTEPIPPAGDRRTHMAGWWEGGHFKRQLGDRVLAQVLQGAPGWGVRLEPATLDDWLQRDRAAVQALVAAGGPLLAEADAAVASSKLARR